MTENERMSKGIFILKPPGKDQEELSDMLDNFGYEVTSIVEESSAFTVLKGGSNINLLLVDAEIEEKVLTSLIRKVKSDPALEKLPVIALVEEKDMSDVSGLLSAGCDEFLLKPVNPRILYKRIQAVLESTPRSYNRVQCRIVVEASSGTQTVTGEIVEISEGGAGLLVNEKQREGDILKLIFVLPETLEELTVGAKVLHVGRTGLQYLHGVKFDIVDGDTREKIRKYVQNAGSSGES